MEFTPNNIKQYNVISSFKSQSKAGEGRTAIAKFTYNYGIHSEMEIWGGDGARALVT